MARAIDNITRIIQIMSAQGGEEKHGWGCEHDDIPSKIQQAREMTSKTIRVIEGWKILTLDMNTVDEKTRSTLKLSSIEIAYGSRLLYDSSGAFEEGMWVRTTEKIAFHDNCFFETPNTLYILAGRGMHETISLHEFELVHSVIG